MLTSSREIKRRPEHEGWLLIRTNGSHHIFRNPDTGVIISLPHLKKDSGVGQQDLQRRKLAKRLGLCMTHYVAIVEEEEGKAAGVWFPDLPGCISAGDTLDEAMQNAAGALELWAEATIEGVKRIPPARTLADLKADPEVAQGLARYMVALIPLPEGLRQHAAE